MLKKLKCEGRSELLLDVNDSHGSKATPYPIHAKFTCFKQNGGLYFPSLVVLKIFNATKVTFKKRVVWQDKGISREKNLDLKIQYAVFEQLGHDIFTDSPAHLFAHPVGVECDHLSPLVKLVTQKYFSLRIKTYGKRFSQMVVHKNQPSLRHELTETILFGNQ